MKIGRAVVEMAAVVKANEGILAGWNGDGKPEIAEGLISFNSVGEEAHESFVFPPDLEEQAFNRDKSEVFEFCKTAHKTYDPVVVACLAIAKDILGDEIKVSSDGDRKDWNEGVALACKVTGREIANPIVE